MLTRMEICPRLGAVDYHEVYVVYPQPLERFIYGLHRPPVLLNLGRELGGQEEFLSLHPACPQPLAHTPLIQIGLRGVYMPIAQCHCAAHCLRHRIVSNQPRPQPHLRDLHPIPEPVARMQYLILHVSRVFYYLLYY